MGDRTKMGDKMQRMNALDREATYSAADFQSLPMGATVVPNGVVFRTWAPRAFEVHILGDFNQWTRSSQSKLLQIGKGHWAGLIPGAQPHQAYMFFIVGPGGEGEKRDPYARELTFQPPFPDCRCVIYDSKSFPWHDQGFRAPPFSELIIYQFHVGTFFIPDGNFGGKFLDVLDKLEYLVALGVNAIQPLPIVEFPTEFSFGYNGTDYFSPESDYGVSDPNLLQEYLHRINRLLIARNQAPYEIGDIGVSSNQLRALIDVCHVYGIAVILDVVYNHAGGGFDPKSIYFYDKLPYGNNNDSLFFTDQGWAGGLVYAYWNQDVCQFLIDNAKFFIQEYHIDGFRHDEVSVIDRYGGWHFCQNLTDTCHFLAPSVIQIAEYWPVNRAVITSTSQQGAGYDASWNDQLRDSIRAVIAQAANGSGSFIDMDRLASALRNATFPDNWRAIQYTESHDEIKKGSEPRIPRLADSSNPRSWYARSRSRVALGLILTAPGIPMLFMGQEFLEDKPWSDNPHDPNLIWWEGLELGDKTMGDFLKCAQDLIALRRALPGLKASSTNIFHVHNQNRILAFHRWNEGIGQDVVIVVSLNESSFYRYQLGFPQSGKWREAFNSDAYDNWINPQVSGNEGSIYTDGAGMHNLPYSASIVIPANSILVFAHER